MSTSKAANRKAAHPAKHPNSKASKKGSAPNGPILMVVGLALVLLVVAGVYLVQRSGSQTTGLPAEISVAEAYQKYQAGAFLLDVRQPEEWVDHHVDGTTLIPLGELQSSLNDLPRDEEIVIVCRSGNRSAQARDLLLQAGFTNVTSMAGGLTQWKAAGYPTVSGQ